LSQHLGGLLDAREEALVRAHLAACVLCRAELATLKEMNLAATQQLAMPDITAPHSLGGIEDTLVRHRATPAPMPSGPPTGEAEVVTGFEVGRYVVTRRLGQGAMGQVFAAYDPRLDRNVAIKLLRADLPMVENKPLRQRLEREAQALARLSHPNVVAVHDLGEHGDALFIAMDLIEGRTLTEWLREPHPWPEVQRVFLMAADGLAAAHRAGLVHRDFKPDNVLVGADGVVRVSDFGVSRRVARDEKDDSEDTITGAGSLIGTPAYMSPEQFDGKPADHRSDQFSFSVALFEALSGELPFLGKSLRSLADAVHAGPPERIPSRTAIPEWLERVVLKGLSTKPAERFATTDELIAALKGPTPQKKFPVVPVSIAGAAVLIASVLGWMEYVRRRDDPCFHVDERAAAGWNDAVRAQMKTGVLATKVPWANDAVTRIDTEFTRFFVDWSADYRALCTAPSADSNRAARQACLESQLRTFEAARDVLSKPTVSALRDGLTSLAVVINATACGANPWFIDVPLEPERRERFENLRGELLSLDMQSSLQLGGAQLERVKELKAEATALGFTQLAALAAFTQAQLVLKRVNAQEALALFDDATVLAEGSRFDVLAAEVRRTRVELLVHEADVKQARASIPAMRAAYQRLGFDPDRTRQVLDLEAAVLVREGKFDEGVEKQRTALGLLMPSEEYARCALLEGLGTALERGGKADEGIARSRDALDCYRAYVGADHPTYAASLNSLATLLSRAGREDEAEKCLLEALTVLERDPDQRAYMVSLFNHGLVLKRRKKQREALPEMEKALAIAEGRKDESMLAKMLSGYAEALQELGELEKAEPIAARGVKLSQRVYGESNQFASTLTSHASILASLGRHEEAAAEFKRAIALFELVGGSPVLLQVTRYELAGSLWYQKETRAESVETVKKVRDWFLAKGPNFKDYSDEAEAWLKTHPAK